MGNDKVKTDPEQTTTATVELKAKAPNQDGVEAGTQRVTVDIIAMSALQHMMDYVNDPQGGEYIKARDKIKWFECNARIALVATNVAIMERLERLEAALQAQPEAPTANGEGEDPDAKNAVLGAGRRQR